MARTHKTAHIKAQMAERARQEEEARRKVVSARARSQRSQALQDARDSRASQFGPHATTEGAASTGDDADEEEDEKEVEEEEEVVEEEKEDDEDADEEEDEQDDEDAEEEEEDEDAEEEDEDEEDAEGEEDDGDEEDAEDEEDGGDEEVEEDEEEGAQKKKKKKGTTKDRQHQGKKRTVSDVEDEDLVHVPAFKAQHDSWSLLDVSLQEYMEATRQKIVIAEVIHVGRRNADLRKQVRFQGLQDSEIPLVPDKWEPYQRKYICTHGWKERERSTGKRTSHKLRRTECPFQMLAQVVMRRCGTWGIVMKREVYSHNHPVSDGIYRSYPDIRQVPVGSALMPGIELLVDADAGTSSIYNYIRENSNHRVTMDDVRNLVARMHKKGKLSL
ncbi:hypothetical protein PR003_g7669 [Phytophthora rubi]|uniref:FAR1 domain-containing protein n=1 Tax=Phytophthora rubi TaxID=129364 RepID=A0A6A4FDA0_9STRA|nr:hypothetical protein PR003_g7669 [Phytophthora rubi]